MKPEEIRALREHLHLTQEVFARILGVSFATVNRWENEKSEPSGDYARVLYTLMRLTAADSFGPPVDWQRVGALSAMAAVAGFSPLLTLGAALAPVLIAHLPSWSDSPFGKATSERVRTRAREKPTKRMAPKALVRTTPADVRVKRVSAKPRSRSKGSAP
jgi:transcriptional regulator with XRE-family HTH domain